MLSLCISNSKIQIFTQHIKSSQHSRKYLQRFGPEILKCLYKSVVCLKPIKSCKHLGWSVTEKMLDKDTCKQASYRLSQVQKLHRSTERFWELEGTLFITDDAKNEEELCEDQNRTKDVRRNSGGRFHFKI